MLYLLRGKAQDFGGLGWMFESNRIGKNDEVAWQVHPGIPGDQAHVFPIIEEMRVMLCG